ncbi:hypothetical protein N658DRAFT_514562 [Parathielavia hyrcaniae]|uniref:F-box domain-containing protein n=1 Tax=Parathielavia hyrcaniae TaxID=113614 RepID=A0AAN6Q584_9PEZI|nr:hypothetical protein N658DRAFT_514562 [Parathielavia hyrcaniae]
MASSATRAAVAGAPTSSPSTSHTLGFLDLPREVQTEVIKHCSTRDLICVALVSKLFRDLAAAQLYREFSIVFPDEDNPQFDTPVDSLAGGLDTFVTSDYNYAQYLKSLCFDTLYLGDKAETSYRPYLANLSCGKFMNTLLLLTLRKARALESFKWNIRVELSRPVYKELHQIASITHLHIRLHAGPSQYETPPPLPYTASHPTVAPGPAHVTSLPPPPPPAFGLMPPPPPQGFYVPATAMPLPPLPKPPRAKAPKKPSLGKEPPTLSGFRKLRSLAVLDMDNLDIVSELQACVQNSAGTLSKLKLSFSEKLASSARKPTADPESEDSDQEDEIDALPVVHNEELSGPARAFRAQEERKTQESVLGRIFDVESIPARKPTVVFVEKKEEKKSKVKTEQELVNVMKTVATKFLGELNGTTDFKASQDVSDLISLAAYKYLEEAKTRKETQDDNKDLTEASASDTSPSSDDKVGGAHLGSDTVQSSDDKAGGASLGEGGATVSLFSNTTPSKKARDGQGDADPDDIDIEEPEEQLAIEPGEPPANDASIEPGNADSEAAALAAATQSSTTADPEHVSTALESQKALYKAWTEQVELFESRADTLAKEMRQWEGFKTNVDFKNLADAESWLLSANRNIQAMKKDLTASHKTMVESLHTFPTDGPATSKEAEDQEHAQMRDYLRESRGIALQSLRIYLIPVKASVLSRAVDLRMLRRLTLLNVGVQAPIWALLHKENKEAPLPLRKIFTDNVSLVFLNFVSSLQEVHELFMLERENKAKPESFAPKTQTTIDQIRKIVLKKHLPHLLKLMIKNLSGTAWDVNEKAILLLCRQGRNLEELACNMSIRAMHCLMQHVYGLSSLRALHVVHLRNDDTCVWVMRETKKFLTDNVSHYPDLKLEWIAIDEDDRVDKLVRVPPSKHDGKNGVLGDDGEGKKKGKDKKGKGKLETTSALTASAAAAALDLEGEGGGGGEEGDVVALDISALIAAELGEDGESSASEADETDGEEEEEGLGQKIQVLEGFAFSEVEGVRIFKKEVVAGRL